MRQSKNYQIFMLLVSFYKSCSSGTPSVSPTNQTILVAVDSPLEIIFSSTQIYPCDAACDSEKIQMSLNNVLGCTLNFDRDTGTMTRDNFSKQPCKDSRSDSWRATTSNPPHADDIYLKIERAHAHDRYLKNPKENLWSLKISKKTLLF